MARTKVMASPDCLAAEAVVEALLGVDAERRRLLGVERAQPAPAPAHLLQRGVLADQGHDVGGRPDLGDLLVRYAHARTVPRRCRTPCLAYRFVMAVTIYGVCALTFMMGMYALEARGRAFVLAFAFGCALSSSYGFLSGAWPFGVVEAIWTVIAFRRYLVAGA